MADIVGRDSFVPADVLAVNADSASYQQQV